MKTNTACYGIIKLFVWGTLLSCFLRCGSHGSKSSHPEVPNVLLILADDMGYSDLGCYGSEIQTPNFDRLAREGMRMTQFYNTAKCTETRATLLTGLHFQQSDNVKNPDNNVTLAELFKAEGYRTILSGKWHVGHFYEDREVPNDRGFDEFFGFTAGAINFFTGINYGSKDNYMRRNREVYVPDSNFYSTDAFTDFAIEQISTSKKANKPFFLYLAHNAPHFPLQVPEENSRKYDGRYNVGWDSLRNQRLARMKELAVVPADITLSPRDSITPAWADLSKASQQKEADLMEVYAGMVDRLDVQLGRLLNHLDALEISDNTLVIFLSDNGGCPFEANKEPVVPAGPAESARTYDTEWAQVSNTPFRKYKQWIHEGGISTPMIIRWPDHVPSGEITNYPGQLVDVMPTLCEVSHLTYPDAATNPSILPMEGINILPIWRGEKVEREKPMFWEYRGSRAVRDGNWKLVAERGGPWELYDMRIDRAEMKNVIDDKSEIAEEMKKAYNTWAQRIGARSVSESTGMSLNGQDRYYSRDLGLR